MFAIKALLEMLVACCAFMNLCCVLLTADGIMLLVNGTPAVPGYYVIECCAVLFLESAPDCFNTFVKLRVGTGTLGFWLAERFEPRVSSFESLYGFFSTFAVLG